MIRLLTVVGLLLVISFSTARASEPIPKPVEAFLAFAPGGQAEMTVLAIVTGADLGFVIAHHLTRIVLVIAGAPLVARLTRPARPPD